MKFHEALALARAQRNLPALGVDAVPVVTSGVSPTVVPIVLFAEGGVTPQTACKVYVTVGMLRDIDVDELAPGPSPYYGEGVRTNRSRPIALPQGVTPTNGQIQYAVKVNGQYWGLAPVATACSTTSTTTRPPCVCSGTHPDMQLTISGVTYGDSSNCLQRVPTPPYDPIDLYCNEWNRTFCLYFLSGSRCKWLSPWLNSRCGGNPNTRARQIHLYFPSGYNPGVPPPAACTSAHMDFDGGHIRYNSTDFHPDTGGTFTRLGDGRGANDCGIFPASLTVSPAANCTTTSTTTSTTSTSTTSTTTTTTTSTSTTSSPPPVGSCNFQWNGASWDVVSTACLGGTSCNPPGYAGTFPGEPATTSCV